MVPKGTHLGGIRTLEDLRQRCVIRAGSDCWHFRTPDGKQLGRGVGYEIRVGDQRLTVTKASWLLAGNEPPIPGRVIYRCCESHDCANPEHLKCGYRKALQKHLRSSGAYSAEGKARTLQALRKSRIQPTKITPELRQWLLESTQNSLEAGHGLGVNKSHAARLRRQVRARPNSVFSLGVGLS
jgi:hypothetical protein